MTMTMPRCPSISDVEIIWDDVSPDRSEFMDYDIGISLYVEPTSFEVHLGSFVTTGDVFPYSMEESKRVAVKALASLMSLNKELSE